VAEVSISRVVVVGHDHNIMNVLQYK
jgi:hypothetical protein